MKTQKREQSKTIRTMSLSAIIGVFVIVAVLVFGIFGIFPLNAVVVEILGFIGILCIACIMAIPWVDRLEQKDFNKMVCYVFITIISVCMVLWLVCWVLTMHVLISKSTYSAALYNLVRISLIITIQLMVASTIAYVMLKYKKTMIPFQAITYLSNLYIDFYATYLICCLNIVGGKVKFPGSEVIFSKFMIALLVIAFLYVLISNSVIKSHEKRRTQRISEDFANGELAETQTEDTPSLEDKLKRLKNMKEEGLITEEEYEQKKAEMMKDF